MAVLFLDIECFHDFFHVGVKRESDGKRVGWEMSSRHPEFPRRMARDTLLKSTIVTFNGKSYDIPLLWYVIKGADNAKVKAASDAIIERRIKWWEVEDFLKIKLPGNLDHIDLIEPQPNAFASLKSLNGRMHGRRLQDLPFDPHGHPTLAEMDKIASYCKVSDLDATHNLWNALKEPLELRLAFGEEYGQDFRSKSDPQIGEAIIKSRVQKITGTRPERANTPPGTTFRYRPPEWLRFERPELQAVLDRLREEEFVIGRDRKVHLPVWLESTKIKIGLTTYAMGIGGLHSTEKNRPVFSTADKVLVDADVASQYPAIILMLRLAPPSLGKHFLDVYGAIKAERLVAKKARDKVKDKGLKIALNGVYGKLGSPYSVLYAPHLMIAVTLTGQLSLLMLIERAEAAGISVVSGNTDGVLFQCPRYLYRGVAGDRLLPSRLEAVTRQWEADTGFDLEFQEYRAVYNQSVNSYFAIKANGGHKRKGPLGNPWNNHPDDFDPRGQLMKNPWATICSDAALAQIKDGVPVYETIRDCTDIRKFVCVIKAEGGATWRDGVNLGKTVRFYWSEDGDPIIKLKPHKTTGSRPKIPDTDGARPLMDLHDELPDDIDHRRYELEAATILHELGFHGAIIHPPGGKRVRLTKKNKINVLGLWAVAP